MEIKVNDYVRTKDGRIEKYSGTNNSEIENFTLKDIIKSSPQIIDLIEVGDYVNGYYVSTIWEAGEITHYVDDKPIKRKERQITIQAPSYGGIVHLHNGGIKSVLTKEQFSQMEYKIN